MSENSSEVEKKIIDEEVTPNIEKLISYTCDKSDDAFKSKQTEPDHDGRQHSIQCVVRQPYPPLSLYFPSIFHEVSKYHIHMMNKAVHCLTGCIKCFIVDNENYGSGMKINMGFLTSIQYYTRSTYKFEVFRDKFSAKYIPLLRGKI